MLGTRPCGCSGQQQLVITYDDGTAPPVVGNRVTLERPAAQRPWSGVEGPGIGISYVSPDPSQGHQPTIGMRVSPFSPVLLTFDNQGRLSAGPVNVAELQSALLVNGGAQVQAGLEIAQGGTKGHAVTIGVRPSVSSSSRVWIGPDGGLAVDPPAPFRWEVVAATGNARTLKLTNTLTGASITLGTV